MKDSELPQCFVIGLQPKIDSALLPTEVASRRCGQNTGNLVAGFALCRHLDFPEVLDFGAPLAQMNRSGRIGVVQGANQLGAHFNGGRWLQPIDAVEFDLAIVGVGIQGPLTLSRSSGQRWTAESRADESIPQEAFDWIARIAERAPNAAANIGVRGKVTQEALAQRGFAERVEIIGCPSLFINPNARLGVQIAANAGAPERIAVLAGHDAWRDLQPVEAELARLVSETSGSYIGQHGNRIMKITRGEADQLPEEDLLACRDYICPSLTSEQFKAWCGAYGNLFFNVSAWIEHYRRFDFVVGLRLHGVVLALQAGVPALCIAHDARMLELCQTMRIPHALPVQIEQGITAKDLHQLATFDAEAFDANRRALCRNYLGFLRKNGLKPVQWLEAIAAPNAGDAALKPASSAP